jgi:hypothetical protein
MDTLQGSSMRVISQGVFWASNGRAKSWLCSLSVMCYQMLISTHGHTLSGRTPASSFFLFQHGSNLSQSIWCVDLAPYPSRS